MERFHFENPSDPENEINVFGNGDGSLSVSVAEEMAMDSYNITTDCTVYLDKKAAMQLRDYLNLFLRMDTGTEPRPSSVE